MCEGHFTSHLDRDGLWPCQRYAAATGWSYVRELVCEMCVGSSGDFDLETSLMDAMFGENMSSDIFLDPTCTHVGLSACAQNGRVCMTVALMSRYAELLCSDVSPPKCEGSGGTLSTLVLEGIILEPHIWGPYCCLIGHEPKLQTQLTFDELRGAFSHKQVSDCPSVELSTQLVVPSCDFSFDKQSGRFRLQLLIESQSQSAIMARVYVAKTDDMPAVPAPCGDHPGKGSPELDLPGLSTCAIHVAIQGKGADEVAATAHQSKELAEPIPDYEDAAKEVAASRCSVPSLTPIVEILPVHIIGHAESQNQASEDAEEHLYMPMDRCSNKTANLGLHLKKMKGEDSTSTVVTDLQVIVGTLGSDLEMSVPAGYSLLPANLFPPQNKLVSSTPQRDPEDEDKGVHGRGAYLCVRKERLQEPDVDPITDVILVYEADGFQLGSGYEIRQLPEEVQQAYGACMYLCIKRASSGTSQSYKNLHMPEVEICSSAARPVSSGNSEKCASNVHVPDLDAVLRKHSALLVANQELQRRVAAVLAAQQRQREDDPKKIDHGRSAQVASGDTSTQREADARYAEALVGMMECRERMLSMKLDSDRFAADLQSRLDEQECVAGDIGKSFTEFKREVARNAENTRTSKPLSGKVIAQFERAEKERSREIEKIRLRNINLRMMLQKLESQQRAKEQLAEGLHLIDFEQLKMENQTLNEKIEERNEELIKLKRKSTNTVHALTHIKEKLQFMKVNNHDLQGQLALLDQKLASGRDEVAKAKQARDIARAALTPTLGLPKQQEDGGSKLLARDFDVRQREILELQEKLQLRREKCALLLSTL
jgi:hypothetical protein